MRKKGGGAGKSAKIKSLSFSFFLDHLECLQWLTKHRLYVPNEKTVHGATAVYFAAQEGR